MQRTTSPRYCEIHNHLLPGVDDGARTLEESLRNLRTLAADGVQRLIFSSHLSAYVFEHGAHAYLDRLDELEAAWRLVRDATAGADDVPELAFGQELLIPAPELAAPLLADPRVGHGDGSYVLVEFGFDLPPDPVGVLGAVRDLGRVPLVAHPERYRRDGERVKIDEVRRWHEAGALLQVNVGSLLGRYAHGCDTVAWQILAEGLATVIGADNHGDARPYSPAEAARLLDGLAAGEQAELLLWTNPSAIFDDLPTLAVPPIHGRAVA